MADTSQLTRMTPSVSDVHKNHRWSPCIRLVTVLCDTVLLGKVQLLRVTKILANHHGRSQLTRTTPIVNVHNRYSML